MKRFLSLILITFLLASYVPQASALEDIIESQITTNTVDQRFAAIYKDKIVWEDWRNGHADIYMYDISTSTESRITNNDADQEKPAIYGNKIVYEDWRNGYIGEDGYTTNSDIYMYDLSTNTESQITTNNEDQKYPVIYGDKIVFIDDRNGNDIYLYDLATSTEKPITTNKAIQWEPAIFGERIVWEDDRNGNDDIFMYDLSTNTERQITTDTADQGNPAIHGDRIVWEDGRNESWDIYLYDLLTSTESRITADTAYQGYAAIYGDKIVWEDGRNGEVGTDDKNTNIDIYLYDLLTSTESQITDNTDIQWDPVIYGSKIVYRDNRNGNWDIYMANIPGLNNKPAANITSITPNPATQGQSVAFNSSSNDSDGSVVAYSWRSDIDGVLANSASFNSSTLSVGTHNIYLKVEDNDGTWSDEVSTGLTINAPAPAPQKTILKTLLSLLAKPKTVRAGKTTILSGQLRDNKGKPVVGKIVNIKARVLRKLKKRIKKGKKIITKVIKKWIWKKIAGVKTDSKGKFSKKIKRIKTTTFYKAEYPGNTNYKAASSKPTKVTVKKAKKNR